MTMMMMMREAASVGGGLRCRTAISQRDKVGGVELGLRTPRLVLGRKERRRQTIRCEADNANESLEERISSGKYTQESKRVKLFKILEPLRKGLKRYGESGRRGSMLLTELARKANNRQRSRMPEARGDIREIVGEPVFVPLYRLFLAYGPIFRLSFGPKSFVVVSDPNFAKHILSQNAKGYSKGLLAEILDFIMGTGLIPADGEVWKVRRRALVPAIHKRYIKAMVKLFGDCTLRGVERLQTAADSDNVVEMEMMFSRMGLDVIGKAVFNYDFDALTRETPFCEAVYCVLREAEHRSVAPVQYWNIPLASVIIPRQRQVQKALGIINETLDNLVAECQRLVEMENESFDEEYLNEGDPSILRFLLASGEEVTSKQLRDDLMTLLIAGHETTAAVLTWTMYLLAQNPDVVKVLQNEADAVFGNLQDGELASYDDLCKLEKTQAVIAESMRLYPQPPVLLRRAIEDDMLGNFKIAKGSDIFISVWNIHRSPGYWDKPDEFLPFERFASANGNPNEITEDFRYLPFGAGPRKCIGDQFASLQARLTLAMLLRKFDFQLVRADRVKMTTGATIHTTEGLYMRVLSRSGVDQEATLHQTLSDAKDLDASSVDSNLNSVPLNSN